MPTIRPKHREPSMDQETVRMATGKVGRPYNHHDNQFPEDQPAANYQNDVEGGWVAGARGSVTCENEDATHKPGFDHGGAWRMKNKGNDWRK